MDLYVEHPRLVQPRQTLSMKFRAVADCAHPYRRYSDDFPGNCYGYALYLSAGLSPADKDIWEINSPATLIEAVEQDGLKRTEKRPFDPSSEHIVAAFLKNNGADNSDFHFARLDRTGLWSHKQGSCKPSQHDRRSKIIRHPDKAYFRGYDFVAYFSVPPDMPLLKAF